MCLLNTTVFPASSTIHNTVPVFVYKPFTTIFKGARVFETLNTN